MDNIALADELAERLSVALVGLPTGFLDSFEYTRTGRNLTHPIVWGLLARILWEMPNVAFVGVDVRLNLGGGVKFQPDLVAYGPDWGHLFFVDYESPNSSDARVPIKDVDAYLAWGQDSGGKPPYLVVTTLPNQSSPAWELRWTSGGFYNRRFRGRRADVRESPFNFWYSLYEEEFRTRDMTGVCLVNIDGARAKRAYPRTDHGERVRHASRDVGD